MDVPRRGDRAREQRSRPRARASGGRRAARAATAATVSSAPRADELHRAERRRRAPTPSAGRGTSARRARARASRGRATAPPGGTSPRSSPSPARSATNATAPSSMRGRRGHSSRAICRTSSSVPSRKTTFSACAARCGSPSPALPASQSSDPGDEVEAGRRVVLADPVREVPAGDQPVGVRHVVAGVVALPERVVRGVPEPDRGHEREQRPEDRRGPAVAPGRATPRHGRSALRTLQAPSVGAGRHPVQPPVSPL